MNTKKTYRFLFLWLTCLVTTTTLLAKGQVPEVLEDKVAVNVKLSISTKQSAKSQEVPAKQPKLPLKILTQNVLQTKDKVLSQNLSSQSVVKPLKSLVPSLSPSIQPILSCGFGIVFASFGYRIYYHKSLIALLPYLENIFSYFIVINAP